MKIKEITSPGNTAVKEAVRLRRKRNRYDRHLFLVEGEDLLAAALESGRLPRQVFVLEGAVADTMEAIGRFAGGDEAASELPLDVFICSEAVMEKLSRLAGGSRVVAVCEFIDRRFGGEPPEDEAAAGDPGVAGDGAGPGAAPFVYLAGVGDPGNAGSIIRSAAALGAGGVAFSPGAVDPYSSKCQRAAMGAVFRLPLYLDVSTGELIAWAQSQGLPIVTGDPGGGQLLWEADGGGGQLLAGAFVLVLGSERKGVPPELLEASRLRLRIPQLRATDSLNVAMAGTVILYEALRRRP